MNSVFVTGAGTDVGKTYVTALLARTAKAAGRSVVVLKPVASGVGAWDEPAFAESDTARLLAAVGRPLSLAAVEACTPWRYAAALSPDMAAAREGRTLALAELMAFQRPAVAEAPPDALVLVEGVGGVMSPVTRDATCLDWIRASACPVLLVTGSYLGAISHALTAIRALDAVGTPLVGVVVSESENAAPPLLETVEAIARFSGKPTAFLRRETPDAR